MDALKKESIDKLICICTLRLFSIPSECYDSSPIADPLVAISENIKKLKETGVSDISRE